MINTLRLFIQIFKSLNDDNKNRNIKFAIYINDNKYIDLFENKLKEEYNLYPFKRCNKELVYNNNSNFLFIMNKDYCSSRGRMEFGLYDEAIDKEIIDIIIKPMCNLAFPAIPINLKELFDELSKEDICEHWEIMNEN